MSNVSPLNTCGHYVTEKIHTSELSVHNYVTTDNLLPNKQGLVSADSLPAQNGNVTAFKTGDVLIANIRPYLKKLWYATQEGGCSADVLAIRALSKIDSKFLYYALFRDDFFIHVMNGSKGTKMPRGDKSQIMDFLIPTFDFDEQKKIANVLSVVDQKIELNNRINAELEAMAKTLYDFWFVQFDFPDVNGQPYKTTGGKMLYNPTLKREIPEGWTNGIIENVIGKAPKANKVPAKEFNLSGLLPVIDQSQEFICGFTDDNTAKIKPETAHIIFGDHTRAVKLVNFEYARGADGTQILVSNSENMPSYLLFQVVADIDLSSYGYARHYKFLKESKCVIPIPSIAQAYQEKVKPLHEQVKANIFQNHELQKLRDWLLPMLMNGQVTVK